MATTSLTPPRCDIFSHVGMADPVTIVCHACNTWYHTLDDDRALHWLQNHTCKNWKAGVMATAGPGKDAGGIDIGTRGDGTFVVRCNRCHEMLAECKHQEDMTTQPVREAIKAHVCTGTRSGRITED